MNEGNGREKESEKETERKLNERKREVYTCAHTATGVHKRRRFDWNVGEIIALRVL